jgi:UDP-N-acetylmuramate--alanine ligase
MRITPHWPTTVYLVGIKGVAMTALTQVLLDAGLKVNGSDLTEDFVTAPVLKRRQIAVQPFSAPIPHGTDLVIYTAAHNAAAHPQVVAAQAAGISVLSHAEALSLWFNQKKGIAVSGVGGKSTISAMITWILAKSGLAPSYAVGVGDILGLGSTGAWQQESELFVAEADEYCTDPVAVQRGEPMVPRFHYLQPSITVASTIAFDHPDVYRDEAHTRAVFSEWFARLQPADTLLSSDENRNWLEPQRLAARQFWFGSAASSDLRLVSQPVIANQHALFTTRILEKAYQCTLQVPGTYNAINALAAIGAAVAAGVDVAVALESLSTFQSTKRRFEHVGNWSGVASYDDYAHHPREITAVLEAATQWFAGKRLVVAFQPHTFSRTKALFPEFVSALAQAPELVLLDIFASARENFDPSISSQQLAAAIEKTGHPAVPLTKTVSDLADWCSANLNPGDVVLTLGAGDIYHVHEMLGAHHE